VEIFVDHVLEETALKVELVPRLLRLLGVLLLQQLPVLLPLRDGLHIKITNFCRYCSKKKNFYQNYLKF
jgi:hypothetical protein